MKNPRRLVLLFTATYMVSYISRVNYGAIVAELEHALGMPKSQLSLALTGAFISYGAGQIISGIWGDHASPKRLVLTGLLATSAMNLLLPFCGSAWLMLIVWCVNGFAQAFMWPPIVRLMTALLSEEEYSRAAVKVSWGSSLGTIAVYLCSPPVISLLGWRAVFWCSSGIALLMAAVWAKFSPDAPPAKRQNQPSAASAGGFSGLFTPLMLAIMASIILQGSLRDGVTTWMPSYIAETYNLSSLTAILTGVTLPLFGIVCLQLASMLYNRMGCHPTRSAGTLFMAGAVSAMALYLLSGRSAAMSVVFSAMLTGTMHGVNLILICMVPPFFKRSGNVSTASGVLNSCTYIGSALSTYGIAGLSQSLGWGPTLLIWVGIAAAGGILCLVCIRPWNRQMHQGLTDSSNAP